MNLCPCAGRGDPAAECSCSPQRLAAFRDKLSRALLDRFDLVVTVPRPRARSSRPGRPRRRRRCASASRPVERGCRAALSGRRRPTTLLDRAVERLPLSGRGRARVARVARTAAALAGAEAVRPEHVAEALAYRSPQGARRVSELALASFAAASDAHLVGEPRSARFAALQGRVRRARGARAAARARPSLPRALGRGFPPLLRAIHDPPPGLFLRGERRGRAARAAGGRDRRRPRVLAVRPPGRAQLGARARRGRARRRQRPRARRRRRGAPRRARGRRDDRRRARLRHRPRLPGGATASSRGRSRRAGLVVSEYAPGVEPAPWRFPARNRIVAGLCAATVVVEARERSGALITADFALEEGREVFAVPGEITSALSAGSNALLRLGATPLTVRRRTCSRASASSRPSGRSRRSAPAAAARARSASARPRRAPTSSRARPASPPESSPPR